MVNNNLQLPYECYFHTSYNNQFHLFSLLQTPQNKQGNRMCLEDDYRMDI